jgi:hypothetical protein
VRSASGCRCEYVRQAKAPQTPDADRHQGDTDGGQPDELDHRGRQRDAERNTAMDHPDGAHGGMVRN